MPGSATTYTEQAVLAHTLGYGAMTMPTTIYVGLCTTPPSAGTPGTPVAGGSYARVSATFALATSLAPNTVASNAATIEFPAASAPWGVIGWFELFDALTAGHRLFWGPLVDPTDGVTPITRNIQVNDIMRFTAGTLQVQAI